MVDAPQAPPTVAEMRKYVGELLLQRGALGPVGDYKAQVLLQMARYSDAVMRRVTNDVHTFSGATDLAFISGVIGRAQRRCGAAGRGPRGVVLHDSVVKQKAEGKASHAALDRRLAECWC
ncbi:unnamed protein product [Symbiodinium sp. CCMP2592]|nr:unnamed protein product [Symbiodinium sp. CCMP2592]